MTDKEIETALGKMVTEKKHLSCPLCSPNALDQDQPLMAFDGRGPDLFCPHCELGVELRVIYNPNWSLSE